MRKGSTLIPLVSMLAALAALLVVVAWAVTSPMFTKDNTAVVNTKNSVACTEELKICPDGSGVGRVPPNCAFAPCPTTNTNAAINTNTTGSETTAPTSNTLTPATTIPVTSSAYIWRDGIVYMTSLKDGQSITSFALPVTGTLKALAYDAASGRVAYIATTGDVDALYYRSSKSATPIKLDSVTRTHENEVREAIAYTSVAFRGGSEVIGTVGMWEGCADRVFRLSDHKKVSDAWCGSVGVSPDGKTFVQTESNGIATGNTFSVATSYDGPFTPLDWSTWTGDVSDVYDSTAKQLKAGFTGHEFLSNTKLIVSVNFDVGENRLAEVDLAAKQLTLLPSDGDVYFAAPKVVGDSVVVYNSKTIGVYSLQRRTWKRHSFPTEILSVEGATISVMWVGDDAIIMSVRSGYADGAFAENEMYAIDPATGQYRALGSGKTHIVAQ